MRPPLAAAGGSRGGAGDTPRAPADAAAKGANEARSLRVIVADGDPVMQQFYRDVLARLGHQVCVASTGPQLVELCRCLRPDLVIAAARPPELDGAAAAEEVCRERPTPVILVPAEDPARSVAPALRNPYVLACLSRPPRESDLEAAVLLAVGRFEQFQALRQEAADLRQALEERKVIERAKGLVVRYAGRSEEDAYRRLRKLASDRNWKLAEAARAVLSAGEVFQQLERTTWDGR